MDELRTGMNNQPLTSPRTPPEEPVVIRHTQMVRVIKAIANLIAEFKDVNGILGCDAEKEELVEKVNSAIDWYKVGGDNETKFISR